MQPMPRIWLGDDGIMRIQCPQDCQLALEDLQDLNRRHREISCERRPLLVYAESVAAAEHAAQRFASSEEVVEIVRALAIIVRSFFTRALAEVFMKFHKPPYPTRIFTREDEALVWLEPYCTQSDGANDGQGKSA